MRRRLILGSGEFRYKQMLAAKDAGADVILRADFETVIKAADDDSRSFDFVISTDTVDRYGDTVDVDGWKLTNFRKNPVVLWMHDNQMLPVAKASSVRVEDGKLKSRATFTPEGMARFNDTVFEMLKTGFLQATSVGFIPLKYNFVDDPKRRFGIDFLEQELLEFSICTVPANPETLIEGRSLEEVPPPAPPKDAMSLDLAQRRLALARLRAA